MLLTDSLQTSTTDFGTTNHTMMPLVIFSIVLPQMMYVNCMNAQLQMKLFLLQMMDRKLQQLRMFIQHIQLFIIQIICNPQNISHNV